MKKSLMLCAAMVAMAFGASAQTFKISGHVVDSIMNEEYPFVYIDVIQGDSAVIKTYSDFEGNFQFWIPKGEYMLKFHAVGTRDWTMPLMADTDKKIGTIRMVVTDPFYYDEKSGNKVIRL